MKSAPFDFRALPPRLRSGLLLGGAGRPHLAGLARLALAGPRTTSLGLDILLAAWENSPLDGSLAAALTAFDARAGFLPASVRAAVQAVHAAWKPPQDASRLAHLTAGKRHTELLDWLLDGLAREPDNLFWRQHCLDLAFLLADHGAVGKALAQAWPAPLAGVRHRLEADLLFQQGRYGEAAREYAKAAADNRPAVARLGQSLFLQGFGEEAALHWRAAYRRSPWNINLLLRLYDRVRGLDSPCGQTLDGGVTVCLYTCGKAAELDGALSSLWESARTGVRVVVLDNGSPGEDVARVTGKWRERSGGAVCGVRLPVNIGAPAARNWLLRHEWVAQSPFVAFLDDDALLPPSWQARMAQAVAEKPDAGIWGVKVVDLACGGRIQTAEIHLLEEGPGQAPAFSSLCTEDLDYGQFDYLRPCLAVTGCFHMYRQDALASCGDFDIRFSPTQYDDLDHCLRLAANGRLPVYTGHVAVRHARLSGALLDVDAAATGISRGNLVKLAAKHSLEARAALRHRAEHALLADTGTKGAILFCG